MDQMADLKQRILEKLAELRFLKNNGQICEFQPTRLDIDDQDLKEDRKFYQLLNNIPPPAKKARLDELTKPSKDDSTKEPRPISPSREDTASLVEEPTDETPVEQPKNIPATEESQDVPIEELKETTPQDSQDDDTKMVLDNQEEQQHQQQHQQQQQQPIIINEEPIPSTPEVTVTEHPEERSNEQSKEESPTRISKAVETIVTPAAALAENHQKQHERVQHESAVQSRIAELRKLGLWTAKRLPKLQEPPRPKTHWDFLLEEARWLHNDYRMEKKWKRDAARRMAFSAYRFVNNKRTQEERIKKEKIQYIRKIAATLSKEIRTFWSSIEKIVDYRQQAKLEETRKKAYGLHLNYILDQTSKFSNTIIDEQPQQIQQLSTNQNDINYLINKDGDGDTDRKESVINVSTIDKTDRPYWLISATLGSEYRECRFLYEPKSNDVT
jgi:hypothetical protein